MTLRYISKFESNDTLISYQFPLGLYQWETSQRLRVPLSTGIAADYAHDHIGYAVSPQDPSRERIRCIAKETTSALLEAEIDEARAECYRIGLGKLYRVDADATLRWAWARLENMPSFTREGGQSVHIPLIFDFVRISPWHPETATTGTQTVNETPEAFTINNPGNLPVYAMVFRLRSNGSNACTNPAITNTTNGLTISTTRDLTAADHELKIDTGRRTVEYSTDDGASYANDYSLFTVGADQGGTWMRLEPGDNAMSVTDGGTANYSFEWEFYANLA